MVEKDLAAAAIDEVVARLHERIDEIAKRDTGDDVADVNEIYVLLRAAEAVLSLRR